MCGATTLAACYFFELNQFFSSDPQFHAGFDPYNFVMYTAAVAGAVILDKTIRTRINLDEIVNENDYPPE